MTARGTAAVLTGAAVAAVALLLAACGGGAAAGRDAGEGTLVLFAELRGSGGPGGFRSAATELTPEQGFDALGLSGPASVSGNPELPPLSAGDRRFGFVLVGCRHDAARLTVSGRVVDAELVESGGPAACAVPVPYLAVFDVPADDVPAGALVG